MAYDKDIVLSVGLEPEDVTETAKQLNSDIDQIFQKVSGHGNKLSTSFKSLQMQMDKARQRSIELMGSISKMQNMRIPTATLSAYDKQIDDTWAQRNKKLVKQRELEASGKTDTTSYKRLGKEIDALNAKYDDLIKNRQQFVLEGNAWINARDTDQFKNMVSDLNEVNNRMVIMKQRAQETSGINLNGIAGSFKNLANAAINTGKAFASISTRAVSSVFSRLGSSLKTVATNARNAAINLAKMAGRTILNGIKKLISAVTSLHKAGNKSNNIFNGGFKAFLRYGLGVRSVFTLIRKLRTALIEGFKDLAQVNEPFNQAMSELMTSLRYLRNAFVAAFAPIIQTIGPILSRFINMIADAVNKVAMLIATLTGKEAVQAIPVYQDYAESAKSEAEKAKEAAKAEKQRKKELEKLKRTIAGFDDVEILKGPDNDDETEEEDALSQPGFTTSPILDSIKDFANKLLDMWKNADFTELGRMLGEKLLNALNKIPWKKIKALMRKLGKSLATLLNGFLETPGLFKKIGETIAEALNSLFEFLNAFIQNLHWDSLGKAIRDGILGFLDAIDWDLIYSTLRGLGRGLGTAIENAFDNREIWSKIFKSFSRGLNALIYAIDEFITSVNWGSIAQHIAEGLNDGIEEFDWNALAKTLSDIINAIFDAWYNFITTFDFFKFGNHIGESLAQAIRDIDWEKGGMSVGETINALFETLNGFIQGIDWAELGNSIKEALLGTLTSINWTTIYDTMTNAGRGLGTALQSSLNDPTIYTEAFNVMARGINAMIYHTIAFISAVNWSEFGQNIAIGLNNAIQTIDWNAIADALILGINAAFDFWYNFVTTFDFTEFGEQIGTAVSRVINEVDWEKGGYSVGATITGLFEALNGFAATTDWEGIGRAVVDAISGFLAGIDWGTLGTFASSCLSALLDTLTGAVEEVDWVTVPNKIGTAIGDFLVGFDWSEVASDAMELFGAALAAAVLLVDGLATAIADWIKTGLTDMWNFFGTEIEDAGGDIGEGILNGIADIFKNIGGWLAENVINPIAEGLASTLDIRSMVQQMFGIELPMIQDYSEALEGLATASNNAGQNDGWNLLKDALQVMHDNGTLSDEALRGVSGTIDQLSGRLIPFSDATDAVNTSLSNNNVNADALNTALSSLPGYTDKVLTSFQNLASDSETASTNTGEVANVLEGFDGISITTPLKIALIKAAIEKMGDEGKLSKEQVEKLQNNLDSFNTYVPESKLSDLSTAFEDTGVDAEAFATTLTTSVEDAHETLGSDFEAILKDVKNLGKDLKKDGKEASTNLGDGLIDGMEDKEKPIKDESTKLIKTDVLQSIDNAADMHSPSKEMQKRGQYLTQGLIQGMSDFERSVVNLVNSALRSALNTIQGYVNEFQNVGARLTQAIVSGMGSNTDSINYTVQNIVAQIRNAFEYSDWYGLGSNIGIGIYNGLSAQGGLLYSLANNLAVGMYNTMVQTLQIHSPSRKFAWIGEMIMAGLGKGIEDNEKFVSDTVQDITDTIEDTASRTKATINLGTNMEEVLASFSDTVISEFDRLIANLQALTNFTVGALPSVVQGKVVPYSSGYTNDKYDQTNEELLNELDYINAHQLSIEDLESLLEPLLRRYLNITFYIGDEQVARHANAGNILLGRRYNT